MILKKADIWYIVVNTIAGQGNAKRRLTEVTAFLETRIKFKLVKTEARGHASKLVIQGIQNGYRKIIAVGGDGTNNEVVNGIMKQQVIPTSEITYCLLPLGTGNDWAKQYKISRKLSQWFKMLEVNKTFIQDVGLVLYLKDGVSEQRYFANVAGMAYDPYVLSEMEKLKRPVKNRLAYLLYGMYYVFKYNLQKARVSFNGETVENHFYLINAGVCKYSGGGMQLVPHAKPDDGKLALTLAGKLTKLGVILNSYRFYNGSIGKHSKVDTFLTDCIKVEAINEPIGLEVDGEILGETPVEFRLIPKALKIIIP